MFSFFSKTLRKSQEKKLERRSSLRRKDSTVSVPSTDFAYKEQQQQQQQVQSQKADTEELYMNNTMIERDSAVSGPTVKSSMASSSSYRQVGKASGTEFGCMADTFKSNRKCARSRSNASLASLGSGYYTTGRESKSNNLGICYLMFGPETKRTLLPSQVTGIDTVKALFVRAFPDKLTMHFLDDERTIKIYIKDQQKELFYELDEMSDVKDRCVLKLVDLNATNQAPIQAQSQPVVMAIDQQSQPKQETYYHLTQSNFIENPAEPNGQVKINDFYSSPSIIHQQHQSSNSFRYAPICQQNGEYSITTPQRIVKPHKQSQPPPVVSSQLHNNSRSSSEPRHNINPYSHVTNNSQVVPETYDNIAEKQRHHQQQQQQQQHYYQQQHQSRISNSNPIYATSHRYPQLPHQQQRDIKSVERDQVLVYSQSPSNRMPINKNQNTAQGTTSIKMGVNAKLQNTSTSQKVSKDFDAMALRQITLEDLVDQRSIRSDTLTPRRDLCVEADADLTEDDMTEISYDSSAKKCCPTFVQQTLTESNLAQAESLDETLIEDYESSKVKMRLMQEQLETLTNLVHKALANKDLNQLAMQINGQLGGLGNPQKMANKRQQQVELKDLNSRTKNLRQELMTVRKLHETLNLNFSDSMKNFIGQLNEKLNSFCRNEVNEKIKLDLIIYKYQLDSGKIETELSDLENVVDDLRQNILKHKSNVSIDDVECYALALSQLSKQLVGLKTSFSSVREHLRSSNSSQKNKHAENKFLNEETASLDLIIRRCKRITGILIILKKLAIAPRQNQLMTHSLNRALCKKKSQFQQQQVPVVVNGQVEYQSNNSMRKLFDDIEGIKPDNEQRLLAIEVDRAFNQLMTEISSVATEINTSLSRKSESLSRGSSVSPMRHPADRRSYDFVDSQRPQMPNNYYHSLGANPHRLPSYAKNSHNNRLMANYNNHKKTSSNNVLLNKIELVVSNPGNEDTNGDKNCFEEENNPPKSLFIKEIVQIEPTEMNQIETDQAESMIEKRNKFRAQKQAMKESKEQELANSNTNSSSNTSSSSMLENQSFPSTSSLSSSTGAGANGSNSPASSFASSPSRTPTPSSPLSQASSPTTTSDANKAASQQLCNNLNNQLQTFAVQSKTIDRSFHLETVQEEDSASISTDTTAKIGDNDNDTDKTNSDDTKCKGNNNNINQLYDQLSHLKPIPRSNIPVKISKPVEPALLTSSMTIAPKFTDQDTDKKVQKSMIPVNKVRFSQTFEESVTCVQQVNEARSISSSSSSSSCASNSSGYNSDHNANNGAKHHLKHSSGLKKSTEFFNNNQAAQSTMVVPRRHLACHQTNEPNTQKRVSLSVTDL